MVFFNYFIKIMQTILDFSLFVVAIVAQFSRKSTEKLSLKKKELRSVLSTDSKRRLPAPDGATSI